LSDDEGTTTASSDGPDEPKRPDFENVVFGNTVQVNHFGSVIQADSAVFGVRRIRDDSDDLAKSRQSFLFDFYRQALRQADITFRMSLIFMSIGAVIVLCGGIIAFIRAGGVQHDTIAVVTALSGILISSCGGAFAIHANRARRHLTRQAERMEADLQADRKLSQTLKLIEEVDDPQLRDRLKSVTAMRVLSLDPDPENVANHLLARQHELSTQEIPPRD